MKKTLVIGASNVDITCKSYKPIKKHDKNPGITTYGLGGVSRNIYEAILRLGVEGDFITIFGNDMFSSIILENLNSLNGNVFAQTVDEPTSSFTVILDKDNDCEISISSMEIIKNIDEKYLNNYDYTKYEVIVCDCNSKNIVDYVCKLGKIIYIDATSSEKVSVIKPYLDKIAYLKCTYDEAFNLLEDDIDHVNELYPNLCLIITNKERPIRVYQNGNVTQYEVEYVKPVSAIGAGDCFSAGVVYGIINDNLELGIKLGTKMAALTLSDTTSVSKLINKNIILGD